ncbi:hypothetical protein Hypma_007801 [Hypsizygus marmoreus]|uniref:Uncharacterized protein n=1 Tax=Hypsizygus marmoreus TaxID=39966 RepID=A0A369JT75_HYPMA|nr:hypothetical protein Hypma_007801 [Hypsizygus marmoreus]
MPHHHIPLLNAAGRFFKRLKLLFSYSASVNPQSQPTQDAWAPSATTPVEEPPVERRTPEAPALPLGNVSIGDGKSSFHGCNPTVTFSLSSPLQTPPNEEVPLGPLGCEHTSLDGTSSPNEPIGSSEVEKHGSDLCKYVVDVPPHHDPVQTSYCPSDTQNAPDLVVASKLQVGSQEWEEVEARLDEIQKEIAELEKTMAHTISQSHAIQDQLDMNRGKFMRADDKARSLQEERTRLQGLLGSGLAQGLHVEESTGSMGGGSGSDSDGKSASISFSSSSDEYSVGF